MQNSPNPSAVSAAPLEQLGQILSPFCDSDDWSQQPEWPMLLAYAQEQGSESMLHYRSQHSELALSLPPAQQLKQAYRQEAARALRHQFVLKKILEQFHQVGIVPLLLKGAATYCDHLYESPALRPMGDLDILIEQDRLMEARQIVLAMGFIEERPFDEILDGNIVDQRHHQLPACFHPQWQVEIELHFAVSYGQSGRILPVEMAWQESIEITFEGFPAKILNPKARALHNIVHACKKEYLIGSVYLLQLLELSYLVHRYADDIDWDWITERCRSQNFVTPLVVYCALARRLFDTPIPSFHQVCSPCVKLHHQRLWYGLELSIERPTTLTSVLKQLLIALYYRYALFGWSWHNVCYAPPGIKYWPTRIGCVLKRLGKGLKALKDPHYDPRHD